MSDATAGAKGVTRNKEGDAAAELPVPAVNSAASGASETSTASAAPALSAKEAGGRAGDSSTDADGAHAQTEVAATRKSQEGSAEGRNASLCHFDLESSLELAQRH